ncbi:MAG: SDR family NAD(P)-dependent oxidoreductase [Candidatus Bathyarchaeia archaeon]|jgi:3-oxoacyl-[acyl-carrier protein] reductase
MERLHGKVAVVTGSGKGIGEAIAKRFAKEGAYVVVNARTAENVDRVVNEINAVCSGKAVGCAGDVSKKDDAERVINTAVKEFGKLDILVNNAGFGKDNLLVNMTEEEFDQVIAVHLKGAFLCTQFAAKIMIQQKSGRIINVTSRAGLRGNVGQVNYSSAKAALIGFTKTCALELGRRYGITVNAIAPAAWTDMTRNVPEKVKPIMIDNRVLARMVDLDKNPDEITGIFVLFASDEGGYMTGQVISVDGGGLGL